MCGRYSGTLRLRRGPGPPGDTFAAGPSASSYVFWAGDTVAAVAARWGFRNTGRFAAAYRTAYGVLPGDTLRS